MADSRFKEAFSMTLSTMLTTMGAGMLRTCAIFFLTLLGALPLGFVIYFARKSKIKVLSSFTKIYISIMRGTPLMLQLLVWYFGPYYLFGVTTGNIQIGPFNCYNSWLRLKLRRLFCRDLQRRYRVYACRAV